MTLIKVSQATVKQIDYIQILINDLKFINIEQRNAWLSQQVRRKIRYIDELTKVEASKIIEILREMKDDKKPR